MSFQSQITGKAVTLVEFDLDKYLATWFETVTASQAVAHWSLNWNTTNAVQQGELNSSFPSGSTLNFTRNSGGGIGSVIWTLMPVIEDVSCLGYFQQNELSGGVGIVLRASQASPSGNGYAVVLSGGNLLSILKITAGSASTLTSMSYGYTAAQKLWIQADAITQVGSAGGVTGVFIRAKVWVGEMTDIPGTYTIFETDESSPFTGTNYVGVYLPSGTQDNNCGFFRARSIFGSLEQTYRHSPPAAYIPLSLEAVPDLDSVDYTPAVLSLGEDLGTRAQVTAVFSDHLSADLGEFYNSGTQWGKFRARQLFRRGQPFRLMHGLADQDVSNYYTRHFITDAYDGPSYDDKFTITAQDILKLADNDRAQAPAANSGMLNAELLAAATICTLIPEGIGDLEYGTQGYVNIAGDEIALFSRDGGIDDYTMLMMQFDGTDGSTTMTDTSGRSHNGTAVGNAQLDTAQFKFGTASLLLDGTGDYVSFVNHVDFAFGNSDFTIDGFIRLSSTGTQKMIYDGRPTATNGAYPTFFISSANVLVWFTNSANRVVGETALTTNTWYHVRAARKNGTTRVFLNGVQEGDDYTDTTTYINGTGRPYIGISGSDSSSSPFAGWIDCMRVSKGIARTFDSPFVPPQAIYSSSSGDMLSLERGQAGTEAADHEPEDRMQQCLTYVGKTPGFITRDLLVNYANVSEDYIPIYNWETELAANLNRVYGRVIAEPTGVNKLISELIQQAGLIIWWDNVEQLIQMQVMQGIPTSAFTYNEINTQRDSISLQDQPEKRLTEVWTYYGVRNPLDPLDQENNYRSQSVLTDLEAATLNGGAVIKKIWGTWIPAFSDTSASRANQLQLGRYVVPPRRIQFKVPLYAGIEEPVEAGGYRLVYHGSQNEMGQPANIPIQVTKIIPREDCLEVEAEEMAFTQFDEDLNLNRVITINTNTNNINLYDLHNSIYSPITDEDVTNGVTLTVIINAGVIVGSASTSAVAFDVSDEWVANVPITVRVLGRIQGAGGVGGGIDYSTLGFVNNPTLSQGQPGGTALYTRYNIVLDFQGASGEVWGGGGGGGASYGPAGGRHYDGTGGGGQGTIPGTGGTMNPGSATNITHGAGTDGTSEAPGTGGVSPFATGGAGGAEGTAGSIGTGTFIGGAGAAGNAIDGVSFVIVTSGPGNIAGPQIN